MDGSSLVKESSILDCIASESSNVLQIISFGNSNLPPSLSKAPISTFCLSREEVQEVS